MGVASAAYVRFIGLSETGKPKAYMVILAPIMVFVGLGMVSCASRKYWEMGRTLSRRLSAVN